MDNRRHRISSQMRLTWLAELSIQENQGAKSRFLSPSFSFSLSTSLALLDTKDDGPSGSLGVGRTGVGAAGKETLSLGLSFCCLSLSFSSGRMDVEGGVGPARATDE